MVKKHSFNTPHTKSRKNMFRVTGGNKRWHLRKLLISLDSTDCELEIRNLQRCGNVVRRSSSHITEAEVRKSATILKELTAQCEKHSKQGTFSVILNKSAACLEQCRLTASETYRFISFQFLSFLLLAHFQSSTVIMKWYGITCEANGLTECSADGLW